MSINPLPPFSCTYTPQISDLLYQLNSTLVISTYQAGKVIFISSPKPETLVQLPRNFNKAMGIALQGDKMAIATRDEVIMLKASESLVSGNPGKTKDYDTLFTPRAVYYTGECDFHDLSFTNQGLIGVNTRFSCLARIDDNYSFTPIWSPYFIRENTPNDQCHLNGLATDQGELKYVTALGMTSTASAWRENKTSGGILMDVVRNEVILEGLAMPHSPKVINGHLYVLLSASGELIRVNTEKRAFDVVCKLPGFVRGMVAVGDYLFVGLSKIRQKTSSFADLPISKESIFSGIAVIYLPTGSIYGHIRYENSVEEIYDVQLIQNYSKPGILNTDKPEFRRALLTPDGSFWAIAKTELDT